MEQLFAKGDVFPFPERRRLVGDIGRQSVMGPVVILTTPDGLYQLADDSTWRSDATYEVLSPGLASSPIYMVTAGLPPKGTPIRVATYVRRTTVIDASALGRATARALRAVSGDESLTIDVNDREASPDRLAERLCTRPATGRVDVAVLYGDEPEPALLTVLAARSCQALNLKILSRDGRQTPSAASGQSAGRWSSSLEWIPYASETFDYLDAELRRHKVLQALENALVPSAFVPSLGHGTSPELFPVIAIVRGPGAQHGDFSEWLRTLLSDLYLAVAAEVERVGTIREGDKEALKRVRHAQWAYMRQSYMLDRRDRLKGISLYGRELWLSNAKVRDPHQTKNCWEALACGNGTERLFGDCDTQYPEARTRMVGQYVGSSLDDPSGGFLGLESDQGKDLAARARRLAAWLQIPYRDDVSKRARFSNKPAEFYDIAMKALERSGGRLEPATLEVARQQLLVAAAMICRPTDFLAGNGTNGSFNYDPLFRLATLDAAERLRRTSAGGTVK